MESKTQELKTAKELRVDWSGDCVWIIDDRGGHHREVHLTWEQAGCARKALEQAEQEASASGSIAI